MELETVWTGDVRGPSRGYLNAQPEIVRAPPPEPTVLLHPRAGRGVKGSTRSAVFTALDLDEWRLVREIMQQSGYGRDATLRTLRLLERDGFVTMKLGTIATRVRADLEVTLWKRTR